MRVLIAKYATNEADCVCRSINEIKRMLNEVHINTLLMEYALPGRETGLQLLQWASQRSRLPKEIIFVERNLQACRVMGKYLSTKGFRALSERQFVHY